MTVLQAHRASFTGVSPVWPTQGPLLGIMPCCCHLEILNDFTFDLFVKVKSDGTKEHALGCIAWWQCPQGHRILVGLLRVGIQQDSK